jgi:hypothetical protein
VGKLLSIVVAAVIEARFGPTGVRLIEGIEDILDSILEGFIVGIFTKVDTSNPPEGLIPRLWRRDA